MFVLVQHSSSYTVTTFLPQPDITNQPLLYVTHWHPSNSQQDGLFLAECSSHVSLPPGCTFRWKWHTDKYM